MKWPKPEGECAFEANDIGAPISEEIASAISELLFM